MNAVPSTRTTLRALLTAVALLTLLAPGRAAAALEAGAGPLRDAPPELQGAGYRADSSDGRAHLWLRVDHLEGAHAIVLERIWGVGPASLEHVWDRPLRIDEGERVALHRGATWNRDAPFTVGFVVRAVDADGRMGPPSLPQFVSHAGSALAGAPPRADQILFGMLALGLFALWRLYRRETCHEFKIRLASAAALSSLMFLSVTPAMPWMTVADPSGDRPAVECHLGDETACATYAPDGGPDPATLSSASALRVFELERWKSASAGVRVGLVLSLMLLLPALIWLSVAPRVRAAQAAVAVGASTAAFTLLATIFYRLSVPSWMQVQTHWTSDVALMAATNIAVATALIVRSAFTLAEPPRLPAAQVRSG